MQKAGRAQVQKKKSGARPIVQAMRPVVARRSEPPAVTVEVPEHRHQTLDRSVRAARARFSAGLSTHAFLEAWVDWAMHLSRAPGRQLELFERAQENALKLTAFMVTRDRDTAPPFAPKAFDHRFDHPLWSRFPYLGWQQGFLAAQDWWDAATSPLRGLERRETERTRFMARQALDLVSPSNFPVSNPEIVVETVRTKGRNMVDGSHHLARDILKTLTQRRDPPPEGFRPGKDLACTPGKVVFRNALCELIQYEPTTETVRPEPILIVPAWIMKYYILDLSPQNSLVRFLVSQGFTVFMMSWVNPKADKAGLSLEDYRRDGVLAALDAINEIVPGRRVHAMGYCLGGTMLAIAAATMARDAVDRLATVTLLAAQVDFVEAGELLLFLDESQVAVLEDLMWDQGFLDRPQMTRTFAAIRAEDLIYSRAVRRYFLGREDLPSDIGVWNTDTTRMPARMHGEYLRGLFLENRLSAGRFAVEGRVIALKDIAVPMFVVATETDHIAPWQSVYKAQLFTDGDLTFVLTKGGHNGGILSEPGHPGRHYRISHRPAGAPYAGPDGWIERHDPKDGSWWPEWSSWLAAQSGPPVAPPEIGAVARGLPPLADAPCSYIHQV
ncbi:PHA/PHB synthase family protein [Roseicyclus marinus]|uniref:PHA/PHB synthase family protein n=1 Tax=Roseicyclus marinus TaxID=2161673 RepID=UPI0030C7045B